MSASLQTARELKQLRSQLDLARGEMNSANTELAAVQKKTAVARERVKTLEQKIKSLETAAASAPDVVVSEHAILRYLERVHGLDLDEVRKAILEGGAAESIKFAKTGNIKRGDMTISFVNGVVTTIKVAA